MTASGRGVVAAISMAVAVVIGAVPAQAATAFTVSGTETSHPAPYPEQLLPAFFAEDTVTRIPYPAVIFGMDDSIAVAVAGITNAIQATPGPMVVAGFSQGAVAVARAQQVLMTLPDSQRPAAGQLSFLTVGDPAGPGGILGFVPFRIPLLGLSPVTAPQTPYDSVIVNGEYDGWADFPDRPWNLVSVANALLGVAYVHGRYETQPGGLSLAAVPPSNITTTINSLGGRTTRYLIPTEKLPLVQPLRDIGVPEPIVQALEKPLTAMVDAGYARHDAVAAVAATAPPRQAKQPSRERSGVTRRPAAAATGDGGPGAGGSPRAGAKRPSGQHHSRAAA